MAWPDNQASERPERSARVAVIGFGTRGRCVARMLVRCGFDVAVFDRQFADSHSRPARAVYRMAVQEHASIAGAVAHSALVIVTVTSDAAVEIARSAADHVEPASFYIDASGCVRRDAAAVARALSNTVRLSINDRESLLDRLRTIPFGVTLEDIARHFATAPPVAAVPAYGGAQILPFAPAAQTAQRLPSVRAA